MTRWVYWLVVGPFVLIWLAVRDVIYYVFSPRDRFGVVSEEANRALDRQQQLARVLFVAAFLFWDPSRLLSGGLLVQALTGFAVGVGLAAVALIPSWLIVVGAARRHRAKVAGRAALPLGVASIGVLITGSLLAAVYFLSRLDVASLPFRAVAALFFLILCVGTALVSALWFGFRNAADGYFRAVDGHPFMRPLTLIFLALLMIVFAASEFELQDENNSFPVWVSILFSFLGPVAIWFLGVYELRMLYRLGHHIGEYFEPRLPALDPPQELPLLLGGTRLFPNDQPPTNFGPPGAHRVTTWFLIVGAMLVFASGVVVRGQRGTAQPVAEPGANVATSAPHTTQNTMTSSISLEGDLGLSRPIAPLACTGEFIVVLASAIVPGQYDTEVQTALDRSDDVSYLRTDTSCETFDPDIDGNPIYVVYSGPYSDRQKACEVKVWVRGDAYVMHLDTAASPNAVVDCGA